MANKTLGTRQKMMFRGASGKSGGPGGPGVPGRTRAPAPRRGTPSGGAVGGGAVDRYTGVKQRRAKTSGT